ncbi:MAG TPA: class I SAM-dependent methyltransferase [Candidatus Dormibacteraeota bacterium]|nr:class I SAM-dependent methyltransferase [Candidatus Dormibacteraeota bacterium]
MGRVVANGRLVERRLRIWRADYLHYRYLWPDIERSIAAARSRVAVPSPLVLDVGCGNRPYRDLFEGCRYVGVDYFTEDTRPDAIMDATRLALAGDRFDIVFCTQVIEHVPDPADLVAETYRVLKPGGCLVLTGPFWWPHHEEPHDFQRFTRYGFANLLRRAGYEEFEITPEGGDWAQVFLAVNLRLPGRALAPLRLAANLAGVAMDRLRPSYSSPSGWTVIAHK